MSVDLWADGAAYDRYMGRWSRAVAADFVPWLGVPLHSRWIDVGCGSGRLTETILAEADPVVVLAVDRSTAYLSYAQARLGSNRRVQFRHANALALPVKSGSCDAVVCGCVLNFLAQPVLALAEFRRVTRSGGTVGAYVWDYGGEMAFLRAFWAATVELNPGAAMLDEGRRFPLCRPEPLADLFGGAGMQTVDVQPIQVPTHFGDFDDFWLPLLGGQGPAASYLGLLTREQRADLRRHLQQRLPAAADGTIRLSARAWAVRGIVP